MSDNSQRPNELRPEFLHTAGLNPFQREDSSARVNMFSSSHIAQALVVKGATPRRTQTGVERKFGRTTFKVKMPCNAVILKIIDKYQSGPGYKAVKTSPMTYVIYEDTESREVGILELPKHHCMHQHFGFKYHYNQAATQRLYVGGTVARGTVIADSPAVTRDGDYCYGVDTKVALMSVPGVIEDGVIVSKSYLKKIQAQGIETMTESWGKEWYPLNLYGNAEEYKPFPDIGEKIRDDGLLMVLRRYDDMLAPVEMSPAAVMKPDYVFDRLIYATPGATVSDITIKHDNRLNPPPTPVGMEEQTERYYRAHQTMYKEVIRFYRELKSRRHGDLKITKEFHNFLVEAMLDTEESGKDKSIRMYRRIPLDDWRVEITYEYDVEPETAYKLTGCHGDKGVICSVWDDEDMPVDMHGNRAEIIMDGDSTVKRMNLGRLSEQYINATGAYLTEQVRAMMREPGVDNTTNAWNYLLSFYQHVSPRMYELMVSPSYKGTPAEHVEKVLKDGIILYTPTDNPLEAPTIARNLKQLFQLPIGPVTYRGRSGNMVTTELPILIGSMYIMLLEKTGTDWSATASARLQAFGLPSRLTNRDKHTAPGRNHPVRLTGEDEVRLLAATIGSDPTAEILERSNNPATHKLMVATYLRSEQPSGVVDAVDRTIVPRGNSRPLLFVRNMLGSAGIEFEYVDPLTMPETVYHEETPIDESLVENLLEDDDEESETPEETEEVAEGDNDNEPETE